MKDFYTILRVPTTASQAVIRAAYRSRAKELHPDGNSRPNATEAMADVNEAYETLKDPAKRRVYDLQFKVREFVPKVESESGTLNLIGLFDALVRGRIPKAVIDAVRPVIAEGLQDRGITPNASTVDEMLRAVGWLKPRRKQQRRRA